MNYVFVIPSNNESQGIPRSPVSYSDHFFGGDCVLYLQSPNHSSCIGFYVVDMVESGSFTGVGFLKSNVL